MNKLLKVVAFCILSVSPVLSQLGGNATYQFLNLTPSARQAALGGKILTILDSDVSQPLVNPSTINLDMDKQLAINYSSYFGDISYGSASYAYTFDRHLRTFHAGVTYVNYGTFQGADAQGNLTGKFSGTEAALSVGYGNQLGRSDFYAGGNIKFITSTFERYNSLGAAVDLGLLYKDEDINFQATIVVRNVGMQITKYANINENLPFEIAIGLSQKLERIPLRWHLTIDNLQKWGIALPNPARTTSDLSGEKTEEDLSFLSNITRRTVIGAELFPDKAFNIRLGYNFRRGEELRIEEQRNFSGISFGVGLKLNKMRFSFTHTRYTTASNNNFLGVLIDLK